VQVVDAELTSILSALRAIASRLTEERPSLAQAHGLRSRAMALRNLVDAIDPGMPFAEALQRHAGAIAEALDARDGRNARAACSEFEQALDAWLSGADAEQRAEHPADPAPPAKAAAEAVPVRDHGSDLTSVAQLGELVRSARTAAQRSQSDIAAQAGVGRRFVGELESGKSTLEIGRVLAVCGAAGVTLTASTGSPPAAA
jgi:ribosome-binding protein aMBF1 (putative translation factor)